MRHSRVPQTNNHMPRAGVPWVVAHRPRPNLHAAAHHMRPQLGQGKARCAAHVQSSGRLAKARSQGDEWQVC